MSRPREQELMYANGFSKGNCKKLAKFYFGKFFKQVEINHEDRMFEIYINETIINDEGNEIKFSDNFDKNFLDYFKSYWGEVPGFKLVYFKKVQHED